MNGLDARLRSEGAAFNQALNDYLTANSGVAPRLDEAMRYSLMAGGKRLRPILCLWAHDALAGERTVAVWHAALSLEMVHTYSLIHDDLPAMDDDDLRRGQPSCHRRFDEATAILAGDALHSEAFAALSHQVPAELAVQLISVLARAIGNQGMAGGQQLDLSATAGDPQPEELTVIHERKTGCLMGAALVMGALCGGLDPAHIDTVEQAGRGLGLAFQIADDVLDATVDSQQLGKSAGKDRAQGKLTAVGALGVDRARTTAEEEVETSLQLLRSCALVSDQLEALAHFLVGRDR